MVKVKRITIPDSGLLNPAAPEWRNVPRESLSLEPTPLLAQPSAYVQAAWKDRPYGSLKDLNVQAAHDGNIIFFRLSWTDATKDDAITDTDMFPDSAAVLFPVKADAPLASMGSPDQPVNAWLWRSDMEAPFNVTAKGVGTTVRNPNGGVKAIGEYAGDGWNVVLSRRFPAAVSDVVYLHPGETSKVAFAVWQGSVQERGGLKSVTLEWQPLEIES